MPVNTERLSQVGPLDPRTGFPMWYEDATGTRLELGWQTNDPLAPVVIDPAESGILRGVPDFPGESFYFSAETKIPLGGGDRKAFAQVILALEATFATGHVEDGQQIVFGRTRFRVRGGRAHSTYTLTHPYGTVEVTTDDRGRASDTQDIGVAPLSFADALGGRIAPFLRWTPDPTLPEGYIGDGTTEHTITGSPFNTDFALVEGPDAGTGGAARDPNDPGNPNKAYTDRFVVQGRLATLHGAEITRAVYHRAADGASTVEVFARSAPAQQLGLSLDGQPATPLEGGNGPRYFARIPVGSLLPTRLTVTNLTDAVALPVTVDVTDAVEITQADYDSTAQTLTVGAASSDRQGPATLTVTDGDEVLGPPGTFSLDAPPAAVTVRSSAGANTTTNVRVNA